MRVYCVQLNIAWEDKAANFARVRQLLAAASVEAGSLVLLPEMFATGFSMNTGRIGESAGDQAPTHAFLAGLAKDLKSTVIGGVVRPGDQGKATNRALVISATGDLLADYAKLHPFSMGKEALHYAGGRQISLFDWQGFTVAPTICYDLRFPELYRHATQKGAQLLTVIANWPQAREKHWVALLQARAIENQCYVAGCNRTGIDPSIVYNGRSLIIDPQGNILADAGAAEGVISATIDLQLLTDYRRNFPALADLRPDLLPPGGI